MGSGKVYIVIEGGIFASPLLPCVSKRPIFHITIPFLLSELTSLACFVNRICPALTSPFVINRSLLCEELFTTVKFKCRYFSHTFLFLFSGMTGLTVCNFQKDIPMTRLIERAEACQIFTAQFFYILHSPRIS